MNDKKDDFKVGQYVAILYDDVLLCSAIQASRPADAEEAELWEEKEGTPVYLIQPEPAFGLLPELPLMKDVLYAEYKEASSVFDHSRPIRVDSESTLAERNKQCGTPLPQPEFEYSLLGRTRGMRPTQKFVSAKAL